MHKIKQISTFFKLLFQIAFIALPILQVIGWINAPEPVQILGGGFQLNVIPRPYLSGPHGHAILHTLSASERLLGFAVSTIPLGIQLFILYSLIKLFKLYEKAEIFSLNNVRYIRNIGYSLFIGQIVNCFYEGIMGVVLTWHNPHGHRLAAITFDQTNFGIVIMALLVILISWIMVEGCKLREEHDLTV